MLEKLITLLKLIKFLTKKETFLIFLGLVLATMIFIISLYAGIIMNPPKLFTRNAPISTSLKNKVLLEHKLNLIYSSQLLPACNNNDITGCYLSIGTIQDEGRDLIGLNLTTVLSCVIGPGRIECADGVANLRYMNPIYISSFLFRQERGELLCQLIPDLNKVAQIAGGNLKDFLDNLNVPLNKATVCFKNDQVMILTQIINHKADSDNSGCKDPYCQKELESLSKKLFD